MYKLLITIITIIIIIEFIILLQNNKNTITTSNISNNISNNNTCPEWVLVPFSQLAPFAGTFGFPFPRRPEQITSFFRCPDATF